MDHMARADASEQISPDQLLREFAEEFIKLDLEMGKASSGQNRDTPHIDQLIDAQSEIIRCALEVQASDVSGVLAKMSIWVADAPDLASNEELSRHDAILLSAYADLAKLGSKPAE